MAVHIIVQCSLMHVVREIGLSSDSGNSIMEHNEAQ